MDVAKDMRDPANRGEIIVLICNRVRTKQRGILVETTRKKLARGDVKIPL